MGGQRPRATEANRPDATVLDVGCGTGRVTEQLLELVPRGRVLAFDASSDKVELARARVADRAEVWRQDVLSLEPPEPADVIASNAVLHWVTRHERMWRALRAALRPGGRLEIQCGGLGNIAQVREVIDRAACDALPELVGCSPWEFAAPEITDPRLQHAGFSEVRFWLQDRPTYPDDVASFVRASMLAAHLQRLPDERREEFMTAVAAGVRLPLDYIRLNVSARRGAA